MGITFQTALIPWKKPGHRPIILWKTINMSRQILGRFIQTRRRAESSKSQNGTVWVLSTPEVPQLSGPSWDFWDL